MTFHIGIYPIVGIALAAALYALFRWCVRMKWQTRAAQWYIVGSMVLAAVATFVQPVRVTRNTEQPAAHSAATTAAASSAAAPTAAVASVPTAVGTRASQNSLQAVLTTDLAAQHTIRYDTPDVRTETSVWMLGWVAGMIAVLLYTLFQVLWLLRMRLRNRLTERTDDISVYDTDFSTPFSFGRSIFLPATLNGQVRQYALLHEHCHVRRHHFRWLCAAELLVALQWFNPFVWILFNELKLQQEMQVDADMMHSGADRESYQMALLRVCSNSGRWVLMQTAFGTSPLKNRIIFMNRRFDHRRARRYIVAASVALACITAATAVFSCRTEKEHNPLDGCWALEWIRNTNDRFEHVPPLYGNLFYGNDMQCNFTWFSRFDDVNMTFNFSGEQMPYRDGVLYNVKGDTLHYTLIDKDTHQMQWHKDSLQVALVDGPDITEQLRRVKPDPGVLRILHALFTADSDKSNRFCGTWKADEQEEEGVTSYFIVQDGLYFRFSYFHTDGNLLRRGAGGWAGEFRVINDTTVFLSDRNGTVRWRDNDHISLLIPRDDYKAGLVDTYHYHRSTFPTEFRQILSAAFPDE